LALAVRKLIRLNVGDGEGNRNSFFLSVTIFKETEMEITENKNQYARL
jgi:hypothetical protein